MRIGVRVSELMTHQGEHRVVRLPQDAQDVYQINLYRYLHAPTKNGEQIIFKSWPAYGRDTVRNSLVCYVSELVFGMLDVDINGEVDVTQVQQVTLGCDPEFFIMDSSTNGIVLPDRIFPRKYAAIGYDGLMAELRPNPTLTEDELCGNLWFLFQEARKETDAYCTFHGIDPQRLRFIGTSYLPLQSAAGLSAGFHLHYGIPKGLLGNVNWRHPKRKIAQQITKILDYYVGIPSVITEDFNEAERRSSPFVIYGKPGSFRMDNRTLEYRTPGGAMLRHPTLTKGLIGLGALVMEDLVVKVSAWTDSFSNIEQLANADIRDCYPNVPKDPLKIFSTMCSRSNAEAKGCLTQIADDLAKMAGFESRRGAVEELLNCLASDTDFNKDIEVNWRSYYEEQPRTMGVFQPSGQTAT